MKVLIDTNVVVSANLSDQGPSAAIFGFGRQQSNSDVHFRRPS
jgi:predicted nucleic acid-binding protein